jgi:chemotaxis protein methyltransferase CheR
MGFVELELGDEEYEAIRALLKERTGIDLADAKRALVHNRLARRVRDLGVPSFGAYLDRARSDPEEASAFVSALTTNVTEFFREQHHFQFLTSALPELSRGRDQLTVWSAACSTGEEPWSIAVTLAEAQPPVKWRVLATDIDEEAVATAQEGVYPSERARPVPAGLLTKYFQRDAGYAWVRVKDELRQNVSIGRLNLLHDWPMRGPFDFIFCRNVLIYFDGVTRARLVTRLANHLRPGGYLFLGHSEALLGASPLLAPRGKTTFQRVANRAAS